MGVRVHVAEDEALVALCLLDFLEGEGHEAILAHDGVEALAAAAAMAAEGRPSDLLITDLRMPGTGGGDLIRALRQERPGLPVVVVTGSAPPGGEAELRRLGGTGPLVLLNKPLAYGLLTEALRDVVAPVAV